MRAGALIGADKAYLGNHLSPSYLCSDKCKLIFFLYLLCGVFYQKPAEVRLQLLIASFSRLQLTTLSFTYNVCCYRAELSFTSKSCNPA